MARTSVSIGSGVFSENAQEISTEFFGGNILFDRDRVGEAGTYDEKASALNLGLIRYPGGNVSELFFDIADPEKSVEVNGNSGRLMPLSDFLDYINDAGIKGSFVAPTVPFMDGLATGAMTIAEVRSEMRAFLTDLKAGVYGDASNIAHIEIGNEYYGYEKFFSWSAVEQYAEIAPIWAKEIREIFGDDLNISVQGGANFDDNAVFLEAFSGKGDLVDSVVYHSYPWNLEQVYNHDSLKGGLSAQWEKAGITDQVFMSEWGVSNQRQSADGTLIGTDQIEDGLARGIAMVEMVALQIRAGVDFATVWPVQQNTRGDLAGNEGQTAENAAHILSEDGLTVAGEAFQMMSEVLPGMRILDMGGAIDLDNKDEEARFAPELLVRGFEDDTKIVIFVSAWAIDADLGEARIDLALDTDILSYDIATLTVSGDNYTNALADPVTFEETGLTPDDSLTISFSRDYELKRIILHKDVSAGDGAGKAAKPSEETTTTVVGEDTDDRLLGDDKANGVWGGGGDDVIYGRGSGDQLIGGTGADWLYGGDGLDFLHGGAGIDTLLGGRDSDTLLGGRNGDRILGGGGADKIKGGSGGDNLIGGAGADRMFGNGGKDVLSGRSGADQLDGGAGADTLKGGGGADTLKGGGGDDMIEVGPGHDVATGGAGADVFIIRPSSDTATITDFGTGDDKIDLIHVDDFADLIITGRGGGDTQVIAGDATILLEGVRPGLLNSDDFIF